jgi:hypothetical protein
MAPAAQQHGHHRMLSDAYQVEVREHEGDRAARRS